MSKHANKHITYGSHISIRQDGRRLYVLEDGKLVFEIPQEPIISNSDQFVLLRANTANFGIGTRAMYLDRIYLKSVSHNKFVCSQKNGPLYLKETDQFYEDHMTSTFVITLPQRTLAPLVTNYYSGITTSICALAHTSFLLFINDSLIARQPRPNTKDTHFVFILEKLNSDNKNAVNGLMKVSSQDKINLLYKVTAHCILNGLEIFQILSSIDVDARFKALTIMIDDKKDQNIRGYDIVDVLALFDDIEEKKHVLEYILKCCKHCLNGMEVCLIIQQFTSEKMSMLMSVLSINYQYAIFRGYEILALLKQFVGDDDKLYILRQICTLPLVDHHRYDCTGVQSIGPKTELEPILDLFSVHENRQKARQMVIESARFKIK